MSQKNQHASQLAQQLVLENFGETPAKVFEHLAKKGQQTLADILRHTRLLPSQAKQALLVLVQQNCVDAYTQPGEETYRGVKPPQTLYEANTSRVVQIIRHPKFLLLIKDEEGEDAEQIIETLLLNGRLRFDQLLVAVAAKHDKSISDIQETFFNKFSSLVQSHYIERAPPAFLPPPIIKPHPASVKRKGAKAGSEEFAEQQAGALLTVEGQAYAKFRYKVPLEQQLAAMAHGLPVSNGDAKENGNANGDVDMAGATGKKRSADEAAATDAGAVKGGSGGSAEDEDAAVIAKLMTSTAPKKKKMKAGGAKPAEVVVAGGDAAAGGGGGSGLASSGSRTAHTRAVMERVEALLADPSSVLWRVNNEEFNRRLRHKAIIEMVSERLDQDSGTVVAAMLTISRSHENRLKEDRSVLLSEDEVSSKTAAHIANNVLPPVSSDVPAILRTLAGEALELVTYAGAGPGGENYYVNLGRIIDLVRLSQLEALVKDKFGVPGLRIFRLLILRGQLEQKQIADIGMLPQKDTREVLYRMLRAGYIETQDIPKGSDRAAARTFYTWNINVMALNERVGAQLYRTAANVWSRLKTELDKEAELLALFDAAREAKEMTFQVTQAQRVRLARLKKVKEVMETSLLRLDDMIAVFNDF